MDGNHRLSNAHVDCWATHQVTGARRTSPSQMAYGFEALQESLSRLRVLQATTVAESVPCWHVTPFDRFGGLTIDAMQTCSDVEGTRTERGHCLDIRLVVICDHLVRDHSGALDGLTKECFCTRRVAVLAKQDIDDHAILIDGSVEIPFLSLANRKTSSTNQRLPTGRRRRRTSFASRGAKACTQSRTVRWDTSIARSANSSTTCRLDSG
jgi:hypothetical protein